MGMVDENLTAKQWQDKNAGSRVKNVYDSSGCAQTTQGNALGGIMGVDACRTPLLDLVRGQRHESLHHAVKAGQLGELEELLVKNPDVARILDLMDIVRR